jgi:hypothetical protein
MSPLRTAATLLLLAGLSCPGEDAPPPPAGPPQQVPSSWQANGYVWVPGHWDWTGHEYSWRAGSWQPSVVPAQTPLAWIEGQWARDPAGEWTWVPGHYEQIGASGQTQAVTAQTLPPTTVVVQDAAPAETVVVEEPGIGYYGPAVIIGSPFFFAPYWGRDGYYHQGWHGGDGGHYYAPGGGYHSPGGRLPGPPLPLPPIRR